MEFKNIPNTCSMIELSSPYYQIEKDKFFARFDQYLKDAQRAPRKRKKYSILYNCTNPDYYKTLTKIGFKHVFSYKGESDVKVLIMDVNKATKITFLEWFRS